MTKKNYYLLAQILERMLEEVDDDMTPKETVIQIAKCLSVKLKEDNPRFDNVKFLEACGLGD